ncbi:hypothetical protein [Colwellia psychrerythraea]|uniref:Uncharacterized protein n=1 Tax=Colwellia psychrerythraea TaxID=28229 RepID=A0A099L2L7_COLPS|nr:hypothetical protein [Colwellia psychrerythraea]KGJ96402.1 hypothetical protein GAB14E_0349 [Colwellia psychrerythraea]
MGTTKSAIKIKRNLAVPITLLTIPVTILLSWHSEKQEQKYKERFKAVLQEVAASDPYTSINKYRVNHLL